MMNRLLLPLLILLAPADGVGTPGSPRYAEVLDHPTQYVGKTVE